MRFTFFLCFYLLIAFQFIKPQDSIEVYIIDSFVPPEETSTLILTFYTSDLCTSELIIENSSHIIFSDTLTDFHKKTVKLPFEIQDKDKFSFIIRTTNEFGDSFNSEKFEVKIPKEIKVTASGDNFFGCLIGGVVFLIPSASTAYIDGKYKFELSKELPIVSFFSKGFNYPKTYLFIEYNHFLKNVPNNFGRLGAKYIFEIPVFEFVAPGVSAFTNFKGISGVSPSLSVGLFKIYNVFTLYSSYRYNIETTKKFQNYHDFTIGLFSSFFTLQY